MKRFLLVFSVVMSLLITGVVRADDVDYSIPSYKGHLAIQEDSSAIFTQEVTYDFDSSYNGQYVTLGSANPVPKGYAIASNPQVDVTVNGQKRENVRVEESDLSDGRQLKVYNAGESGDKVVLTITWKIAHFLSLYQDVAVMNWFPISDWDESIAQVDFTVTGLARGDGQLFAHTGFFGRDVTVTAQNDGYTIHTENLPAKGKLELHAYWPMTSSLAQSQSEFVIAQNHKSAVLADEATIQEKTVFYQRLVYQVVPLIGVLILVVIVLFLALYLKSTHVPDPYKGARLYEIPQDLPPLILAKNIYKQSFSETGLGEEKGQLSFDHMVQATILDLIDRGNLTYTTDSEGQPTLAYASEEGLAIFEKDFLAMLFGQHKVLSSDQLFERYKINQKQLEKQFKKAKTEAERDRVRNKGHAIRYAFSKDGLTVDRAVAREEERLGLPNHFRSLSTREKSYLSIAGFLSLLLIVLAFGLGFFLIAGFGAGRVSVVFIVAGFLLLGLAFGLSLLIKRRNHRCLNREYLDSYWQWRSFERMIATIDQFKQTDLDAIILWNRILVYATLYGQAKRVSKVLKKYHIHLSHPALEEYAYAPHHFIMIQNAGMIQNYVTASDAVSHFSLNSSNGSGGFSGGGFSGGGGGGGGGAF